MSAMASVALQLPAGESAARLALPWGDSAYTSLVFTRWLPGWPTDPELWLFGPPANGFTPSGEGPRRQAEVEERALAGMLLHSIPLRFFTRDGASQ